MPYCALHRFCVSRKGGTGGGEWGHPQGAVHMAALTRQPLLEKYSGFKGLNVKFSVKFGLGLLTSIQAFFMLCYSIYNTCYKGFYKTLSSAKSSCNHLVCSVFQASSLSCCSFVGCNYKFGFSFLCDYSSVDLMLVRR